MFRLRNCGWRWGMLALGLAVPALRAEVGQAPEPADRVARLQALLEEQQRKIDALEAQLAHVASREVEALRTDALRQQIREILSEEEFRQTLMPSLLQAGYDRGFFIRSADEKFLMKVNGRIQFRFTHYGTRGRNHYLSPRLERDDRTGFDLSRIRLKFAGHAYSPDLTYLLEVEADAGSSYAVGIKYAWLNYRFLDEFQFMAGIFKLAGTRAQMISSGNLQMVDRPVTDAVFSLGTGLGVRFWGQLWKKRVEYFVDVVNSTTDPRNRTITPDESRELDNNPAIVGHLLWHALGDKPGDLMKSQSDVAFHQEPALDLGMHYAFNQDDGDARTLPLVFHRRAGIPGGFGVTSSNGVQVHQVGAEAAFQLLGFSVTGEYLARFLDAFRTDGPPFAPYWLLTGEASRTMYQGGYVQVGYFLPIPGLERKLEAVARVGGVGSVDPGSEGAWEYAGGLNYFLKGNDVKLQTDVTKVYEAPIRTSTGSIANVNDDALVWRVQLQVQF
jgi:hypothetical protein